jgi:hypothetical protein
LSRILLRRLRAKHPCGSPRTLGRISIQYQTSGYEVSRHIRVISETTKRRFLGIHHQHAENLRGTENIISDQRNRISRHVRIRHQPEKRIIQDTEPFPNPRYRISCLPTERENTIIQSMKTQTESNPAVPYPTSLQIKRSLTRQWSQRAWLSHFVLRAARNAPAMLAAHFER